MRRETAFQKGSVLTLHDLGHVCQMHVIMIASLIAGIILLSNRIRNDPQQIHCYSADALFFLSFFVLLSIYLLPKSNLVPSSKIDCGLNNFVSFSIELGFNEKKEKKALKDVRKEPTQKPKLIGFEPWKHQTITSYACIAIEIIQIRMNKKRNPFEQSEHCVKTQ